MTITKAFEEQFGELPQLQIQAPGRINLIGEHTDYNEGFVLPASIDKYISFAINKGSRDDLARVYSIDKKELYEFKLTQLDAIPSGGWRNYIIGVVAEMEKAGAKVKGFDCVFTGNLPQGAGLSSSAALECGLSYGLNEIFALGLSRLELVKCSQKAEHNYVGVKCGIMDQFTSMMGQENKVIRLDCRSLDYEYFPLELGDFTIVLCNTNIAHELASSEYNVRRAQCEEGVALLQKYYPEIKSLRDVDINMLQAHKSEMEDVIYRRCKYIVEENLRVLAFCDALNNADFESAGALLYQAHEGMRTEYEISCKELDFLVEFTKDKDFVVGSRLMGGGFGGCTINLVKQKDTAQFIEEISKVYLKEFDIQLGCYHVNIGSGVKSVTDIEY
ncbi:galactokinase [Flexithrix dorotheae]|uniref:galactokinase n=1 Tax=Flexithrix dorotheae TaxID=70993 RepID=UPI000363B961|nr:galactokinase [Flexithrix dorotheae]